MERQLIVSQLFEHNRERLQLSWVSGPLTRVISAKEDFVAPADLVGHLNLMHPSRLQVIGAPELAWAARQAPEKVKRHMQTIYGAQPPVLIVTDGLEVSDDIRHDCELTDTPLLKTPLPAAYVIDTLRNFVARRLAETVALHGVLMDVLGMGVLITGDSGAGKSELALELISRGHGLVADDVVDVSRIGLDVLEGRCPDMLRDFLEVRGLGLINIRTVFGETACRRKMRLKLIVHLQKPARGVPEAARLPLDAQNETILGVPVHRVTLPIAAGRNLAVLLEAAVRVTILGLRGINSMQEFLDRQENALRANHENLL
ncbi:MAG: HPr kinase/phosphorylase [Rhodocyclales bacterium]|jgi:HPr kinase/phosphorylase|nr:HPr kinase/phosphorylase [Rhodocyclales bacterium]MBH1974893.1 HPr kinase/phosphorylase [Rhodocyclales bacterium]MBT9460810.1 HPr kinase/phosphorylase [Rugosibacter sp.]